jgi:pimeloyl-ACP methyl ester carboxylesterase
LLGQGALPRGPVPSVGAFSEALLSGLPERAGCIGYSLDGVVAMVRAARRPAKMRRLVLPERARGSGSGRMARLGDALARLSIRTIRPRGVGRLSAVGRCGAARRTMVEHVGSGDSVGLHASMIGIAACDGRGPVERIVTPTPILRGDRNARTRRRAALTGEAVPKGHLAVPPGGPLRPDDRPDAVHGASDAFLGGEP